MPSIFSSKELPSAMTYVGDASNAARHFDCQKADCMNAGQSAAPNLGTAAECKGQLASIYRAFGEDTLLVPLVKDAPGIGWEEFTIEHTRRPEYRKKLTASHVGVVTGKRSNGLRMIQFPGVQDYNEFAALAHWIKNTFVLVSKQAVVAFFRMDCLDLPPIEFEHGLFVSDTQLVPLSSESGIPTYNVLVDVPVQRVDVNELLCTGQLKIAVLPGLLRDRFGPSITVVAGRRRLNNVFWAHYLHRAVGVEFIPDKGFLLRRPEGVCPATPDQIHTLCAEFLTLVARAPGFGCLRDFIKPDAINGVIRALETVARVDSGPERDSLAEFLDSQVIRTPGQTVLTSELYSAYCGHAASNGWRAFSFIQFAREIKMLLAKRGYRSSGSIVRGTKQGRGFRNLTLKSAGMDGTDGMNGTASATSRDDGCAGEKAQAERGARVRQQHIQDVAALFNPEAETRLRKAVAELQKPEIEAFKAALKADLGWP